MKTLFLICLTLLTLLVNNVVTPTLNHSKKTRQQVSYKDCVDFKFEVDSKDCEFIKKLNSDLKVLENENKEYYITRFINTKSKQIDSYDIVGFEEGTSIYIDYSKEIADYIVYLQKNKPHIIINDFYD